MPSQQAAGCSRTFAEKAKTGEREISPRAFSENSVALFLKEVY